MPISERYKKSTAGIKSKQLSPIAETIAEPRLSNADLDEQIKESGQARQQVTELDRLREQSGQFENLQRERLRRLEVSNAQSSYQEERAEVQTAVDALKRRVTDWRQKLAELEPAVGMLQHELQSIQTEIFANFQRLQQAQSQAFYSGGQAVYDQTKPSAAQTAPDPVGDWLKLVGNDDELKTVSEWSDKNLRLMLAENCKPVYTGYRLLRRLYAGVSQLGRYVQYGKR